MGSEEVGGTQLSGEGVRTSWGSGVVAAGAADSGSGPAAVTVSVSLCSAELPVVKNQYEKIRSIFANE